MDFESKKLIEQLNKQARKSGKGGLDPLAGRGYESQKKKMTISGLIVGIVTGIPLGLMYQLWRFLTSENAEGYFGAVLICSVAVVIGTVAGYFYGAYVDGNT